MTLPDSPLTVDDHLHSDVSSAVGTTLARQDVPLDAKDVSTTTNKVTSAVMAQIAVNPNIAVVPVESAALSKVNWTQLIMLVLTLLGFVGLPLDAQTKLDITAAVVTIGTFATVVFKTFFSRSVTPQSK